jgi:uncharacterized protein (DUF2141 family)
LITNMHYFKKIKLILSLFVLLCAPVSLYAALSCTVAASCAGATLFNISTTTNGHAELPNQSNYTNLVCCTGVTGLGNSCAGTNATVLKLSATTNAHVEQSDQSNYAQNACISVTSGSVSVAYQDTNCSGYDTTVASISGTTNAHVGDGSAYTRKVCASAAAAALSFSLSTNTIGFGALSSSNARYATSDSNGSASETEAHTISAATSAANGYSITVQGTSLTAGGHTISAIGGANTGSSVGNEQFGLRMTATGGTGAVSSPYSGSGFAYAADGTTASQVASESSGDGVTTTYSARYLANISTTTIPGSYSSNLNYIITVNY